MSDKMTILGKDGSPRYIVEDKEVTDLVHEHKFIHGRCKVCKKAVDEIEETNNGRSTDDQAGN